MTDGTTEFRVWNETGDLIAIRDNMPDAELRADEERDECPCGEESELACGVLHPHGIHVQVVEDGYDVTNSYLINQQ